MRFIHSNIILTIINVALLSPCYNIEGFGYIGGITTARATNTNNVVSFIRGGDVSMSSTSASSSTSETTDKDEGKTAGDDAPPVNIGWNSHQEVVRTRYVYIYIPFDYLYRLHMIIYNNNYIIT